MKKSLILIMLAFSPAFAGTVTGNLTVQAQVADACIMVAENVNFGVVTLASGQPGFVSTTGKIRTTCTKDTEYTIKLGSGQSGSFAAGRSMKNSVNNDQLKYNLFSNKNQTTIWGDGTDGTYAVTNIATGTEEIETIQAQVPYDQIAKAGMYTDSIVITIDY